MTMDHKEIEALCDTVAEFGPYQIGAHHVMALNAALRQLLQENQRLRGLVESGFREGWNDGFREAGLEMGSNPVQDWQSSQTKKELDDAR